MRVIGTLHNRRGDPLLLLRLLRLLKQDEKVQSIGVSWSVASGNAEPDWDELVQEEGKVQETLRDCVRLVHDSRVSWDAKSFLGRCYRSFQYEFMVSLNLKRRDRKVKLILLDDPHVRDIRYKEIGEPRRFLQKIEARPSRQQVETLRKRYAEYVMGYGRMDVYEKMVLHPDSVLLETSLEMAEHTKSRQEYMVRMVENHQPDVLLLRLFQCLPKPSQAFERSGTCTAWDDFLGEVIPSTSIMKLSDAESLVGPLPERD